MEKIKNYLTRNSNNGRSIYKRISISEIENHITFFKNYIDNYKNNFSPLTRAVIKNNIRKVKKLLKKLLPSQWDPERNAYFALELAIWMGHLEIAKLLFNKNPDFIGFGYEPLILSIVTGHLDIANFLLNFPEIDVNGKGSIIFNKSKPGNITIYGRLPSGYNIYNALHFAIYNAILYKSYHIDFLISLLNHPKININPNNYLVNYIAFVCKNNLFDSIENPAIKIKICELLILKNIIIPEYLQPNLIDDPIFKAANNNVYKKPLYFAFGYLYNGEKPEPEDIIPELPRQMIPEILDMIGDYARIL